MAEMPIVDLADPDEPSPIRAIALLVAVLNHAGQGKSPVALRNEANRYLDYLTPGQEG